MNGALSHACLQAARFLAVGLCVALVAGCASRQARQEQLRVGQEQLRAEEAAAPAPKNANMLVRPPVEPEPDWRAHFRDLSNGAILISIDAKTLHYWGPNGSAYKSYPIAVPRSRELTRLGATHIARKKVGPSWRPTPAMRLRDPRLPAYVGPGPQNPLGEHAMYLGWRYYAIHGTNNPRSIGTRASSGCFRLYPPDIKELFAKTGIGAQVKVVQRSQRE